MINNMASKRLIKIVVFGCKKDKYIGVQNFVSLNSLTCQHVLVLHAFLIPHLNR